MIKKTGIYITENTNPYKNLAMEEYLTFHVQPGECVLFLWQNRRTVVIGKNQNCWKECRVSTLEEDGGFLVRRLSGGGAVFHDLGNLNFTFCVRQEDYDVDRQLSVILEAVRLLGMRAEKTGRNDITVDGRKFSGNAFFRSGDFCYHHGTLLLSVDKEAMARYLNVSDEKLKSKGVDSVRSRVANLIEFCPDITAERMEDALIRAFGTVYGAKVYPVEESEFDQAYIARAEKKFSSWEWKYGKRIPFQHSFSRRFPWGGVEFQFDVDGGIVRDVNAFSDGMEPEFIASMPEALKGCRYEKNALLEAAASLPEGAGADAEMKRDIMALLAEEL